MEVRRSRKTFEELIRYGMDIKKMCKQVYKNVYVFEQQKKTNYMGFKFNESLLLEASEKCEKKKGRMVFYVCI